MRLVNYDLENSIDFETSPIWTLVCESPTQYRRLTEGIYRQALGQEGRWHLTDCKNVSLDKNIVCVADFYAVSLTDKKANSILQEKIKKTAFDEDHSVATHEIIAALDRYAKLLSLDLDVPVRVGDVDFAQIAKLLAISPLDEADNLLEKLTDYVTLLSRLTTIKILVCFNLRSYLEIHELEKFFLHCENNGVNLLCFENYLKTIIASEKVLWCDKDFCETFPRQIIDL